MAITLTYGGLNLNDGTTYALLEGFDPGEQLKTWSEYRGYASGTVAQYNVTSANIVEMHVPIKVASSSMANLRTAIAAVNALIDDGEQDLVYGEDAATITYHCMESPRVAFKPDSTALIKFYTVIDLVLYRAPDTD